MAGRPPPAARIPRDPEIADAIFQRARDPDVIEPAAAVAYGPVGGAVAPPGIDLLRKRNALPRDVEPFAVGLGGQQFFGLDRGVRHDLQQLLVRPDVVLM